MSVKQTFAEMDFLIRVALKVPKTKYKPYHNARLWVNKVETPKYEQGVGMKKITTEYPYYTPAVTFKVSQVVRIIRNPTSAELEHELNAVTGGVHVPSALFTLLYGEQLRNLSSKGGNNRTILHSERKKLLTLIFEEALSKIPADLQNYVSLNSKLTVSAVHLIPKLQVHLQIFNPANSAVTVGILKNFLHSLFAVLEKYCGEQKP